MIVAIRDHQHKSHGIRDALRECGHWVVPVGAPADVLLIDHDIGHRGDYRRVIDHYKAMGTRIVLYPHGGGVMTVWDGPEEPYPVDACLVIGTGQLDAMLAYGYPYPLHMIGWSFCEQRPFIPRCVERVLFAPIHPLGNHYLNPDDRKANQEAFIRLLEWDAKLTVRHVGPLDANGLQRHRDVAYESARDLTIAYQSIDQHDLVVAKTTFLSLAVARGVPAVTFNQVCPDSDPHSPEEPKVYCRSFDAYEHIIRYPFDVEDGPSICQYAGAVEAEDWRARFIGPQVNPRALSGILEGICREEPVCIAR